MIVRLGQLILIFIPLAVFIFLLKMELVPSGVFTINHQVKDVSPYIDALTPEDRVKDGQRVIKDPVYFFLHPHRLFDRIEFVLWFKNTSAPIVEFGGLIGTKPDVYDLLPISNLLIDRLGWRTLVEGTQTLHQKTQTYDSLEAFFAEPPERRKVAVYKADYRVPFRMTDYVASSYTNVLDVSLRGKHEFKTYIKNEPLSARFEYMDMNRDEGVDPVVITVFNEQGEPIMDARAQDDGDMRGSAIPSSMRELRIFVPELPEGVYKIVLNASRDVFFRKIQTTQSKIIFVGSVFLADETAYKETPRQVEVWTASPRLKMETRHALGVQDVKSHDTIFSITEPYTLYTFSTDGQFRSFTIPKADIELAFDGPLAFSKQQYFQPDPHVLRPYTDVVEQGIEYILTEYQSPQIIDDWMVQTVSFDTKPLIFDKQAWKFVFSVPDIVEHNGEFLIENINMRWMRSPFVLSDVLNLFN